MTKITLDQVFKTYNGKSGCACGCRGRYSLNDAADIHAANERAGWAAYSDESVRPLAVKRCVATINKAIDDYFPLATRKPDGSFEYNGDDVWFFLGSDFAAIDQFGRANTVYFRKEG